MKVTLGAQGSCMMKTGILFRFGFAYLLAQIKCKFEGNNIESVKNRNHQKAKTAGAVYSLETLAFQGLIVLGLHVKYVNYLFTTGCGPQTGVVGLELVAIGGCSKSLAINPFLSQISAGCPFSVGMIHFWQRSLVPSLDFRPVDQARSDWCKWLAVHPLL